ncbi:MAG: hypothetical protein AAF589_00795 [Planctomycetota bacterium]
MQARDLIETAATLCHGAQPLLDDSPRLCQRALAEYWAASRCRLDEWGRRLSALAHHPRTPSKSTTKSTPAIGDAAGDLATLAEDILLSQTLTRAVAALTVAHDRRHDASESGPIGRNVLAGHDETVSRVRALADAWWRPASSRAARLRLITARTERWTDLLLAYVLPLCGTPGDRSPSGHAVEFTFDPTRAQEFAYDAQTHAGLASSEHLLRAAIREAFATTNSREEPLGVEPFHRRIAGAAIGMFGPEAFDSYGLLRGTWIARIERVADDTVGMVEDLFNDETPPPFKAPARWRL